MAIFSKIKAAVKKYVSNVVGGAKIVGSAIAGGASSLNRALSSTNQQANVISSQSVVPTRNQTLVPNISTPQGIGQSQPDGSIVLLNSQGRSTGSVISPSGVGSTPVTLRAGQSRVPSNNTTPTDSLTTANAPITISSTMTGDSLGGFSSLSSGSGASLSGGGGTSAPSAPGTTNPGLVNLGGTASVLSGFYALNPETGLLEPVSQDDLNKEQEKESTMEKYARKFGLPTKKESLLNDPTVRAQQEEVNRRKQEVQNYTAQLNSIVAKQNADLLRLREVGGQEGVTEAVYGGQAAQINREAAIRALPIQAQVAAAQGNLELASDYLDQVTVLRQEEIDNEYNYGKELRNGIRDMVEGDDKRKLALLDKAEERTYQEKKENLNDMDLWANRARESGQTSLMGKIMSLNPSSPSFRLDLQRATSGLVDKDSSGNSVGFVSSKVESDVRESVVAALDDVEVGATTLDKAYAKLRKLYSPSEVSDRALKDLLEMPSTVKEEVDDMLESVKQALFK